MTCYFHPDAPAIAFCRSCGRPLCIYCQRPAEGTVFCPEHVPAAPYSAPGEPAGAHGGGAGVAPGAASNPYQQPPGPLATGTRTSPGLAFLFGWIPGVGAIYNGQYLKGLVHAIITGLLMSLANAADNTAGEPFLVMLMMAFWFYMPFEAYHTAKKRQMGIPVEEWSSLLGPPPRSTRVPLGPVILIGIGIVFLLDTLHILAFREFGRFWPVILILLGAYLLYSRLTPQRVPPVSYPSAPYPSPSYPAGSYPAGAEPPRPPADTMETRHEQ